MTNIETGPNIVIPDVVALSPYAYSLVRDAESLGYSTLEEVETNMQKALAMPRSGSNQPELIVGEMWDAVATEVKRSSELNKQATYLDAIAADAAEVVSGALTDRGQLESSILFRQRERQKEYEQEGLRAPWVMRDRPEEVLRYLMRNADSRRKMAAMQDNDAVRDTFEAKVLADAAGIGKGFGVALAQTNERLEVRGMFWDAMQHHDLDTAAAVLEQYKPTDDNLKGKELAEQLQLEIVRVRCDEMIAEAVTMTRRGASGFRRADELQGKIRTAFGELGKTSQLHMALADVEVLLTEVKLTNLRQRFGNKAADLVRVINDIVNFDVRIGYGGEKISRASLLDELARTVTVRRVVHRDKYAQLEIIRDLANAAVGGLRTVVAERRKPTTVAA